MLYLGKERLYLNWSYQGVRDNRSTHCATTGVLIYKNFFSDGIIPGGRRALRIRNGNRTTDYGFIDAPPTSLQPQSQQTKSRAKDQCAKSGKCIRKNASKMMIMFGFISQMGNLIRIYSCCC